MFYLRKLEISEVSEFSVLELRLKLKTRRTWKYFQHLQIPKNVLYLRQLEISEVSKFFIFGAYTEIENSEMFSRLINF